MVALFSAGTSSVGTHFIQPHYHISFYVFHFFHKCFSSQCILFITCLSFFLVKPNLCTVRNTVLIRECVSTLYVGLTSQKKWLPHRLVQTKIHGISFILSAGLTTVLTWNQRHRIGRLIQDEPKIYRRYHPPNLNVPEILYSFKFLFLVSVVVSSHLNARALAYNLILLF